MGPILFEKLKLVDKPKKTKTGQYSTAEDVLSELAKDHKIVADILDWRSVNKLQSTYVKALPEEIHPQTGRVHTVYNQAVAATGRLSSNNPNLQNIPIRTQRGQQVRKAFIPRDEEHVLLECEGFKEERAEIFNDICQIIPNFLNADKMSNSEQSFWILLKFH